MSIHKMVGAGNDFILLEDFDVSISDDRLPVLARYYCDRKGQYGADGLIVLRESDKADCRMLFFNSDGSAAEMCGNGARCVCRYCYDNGLSEDIQTIETASGIITGLRMKADLYRIRLNSPSLMETSEELSYIELGEPGHPHAVLPLPSDLSREALRDYARKLRYDPRFPKGANVNLYRLTGDNCMDLLTYERGVEDFTLACGTGTGATVLALTLLGKVSGVRTRVNCPGGTLWVDVEKEKSGPPSLFLTGPAEEIPLE